MKRVVGFVTLICLTAWGQLPTAPANLRVVPEYFASPNGTSSNSGTVDSPWSLSYALSRLGPTTVLTLLPGVYPSIVLNDPLRMSGVTLRSQVKWGARIVGSPGMHGIATEVGVSNVVIQGFEIAYPYISGVKLNDSWSAVKDCWIHHAARGNPSWVTNTTDSYEGSGIEAHNKLGTLIENNLIENCGAWIGHDHGIYMNGTNNVVRNNVLRYNLAHGIQVYENAPQAAANCQIYNNLIYGNGRGVVIYSQSGFTNFVYNNTIVSMTAAVESAPLLVRRAPYVVATNNICLGNGYSITSDDGTTFFEDYNLLSTRVTGSHDLVTNAAGFVSPSQGLYWLTSGSPARGMACGTLVPPVDFFGRPQSAVTDVGAFQFNSTLAQDTRILDPSSSAGADYWATN